MSHTHHRRAAVLGTVPLAFVVACAGIASAAPTQPGVTNETPSVQSGVSVSAQRESAPAKPKQVVEPTPDPVPTPDPTPARVVVPDPPRTVPSRVAPAATTQAPTLYAAPLHAPEVVEPVAPIAAPPNTLRLGDFETDKPEWVSTEAMNSANNWSAYGESEIARGWNGVGVSPARSDRLAASTTTGAVLGGTAGAAAAGIPSAAAGAMTGAVIGAGTGAVIGCVVLVPIPVPCAQAVPGALIGAGVGAVAGAGLLGIPAAALGGAAGALGGGAIGTAYGAGDPDDAPFAPEIQVAAPTLSRVDAHSVGSSAATTVAQTVTWVGAQPGGSDAIDAAPVIAEQAASWIADQSRAPEAVDAIERAADHVTRAAAANPTTADLVDAAQHAASQMPPQITAIVDVAAVVLHP